MKLYISGIVRQMEKYYILRNEKFGTETLFDEMEWNEFHKEHKNILKEGFTLRVEE